MNKSLFVLLVLFTFYTNLLSQWKYEPLIDTTKQWNTKEKIFEFIPGTDAMRLAYFKTAARRFNGDTLINNKTYYIIEECINDSLFQNWNRYKSYYLREDTISKIVYAINKYGMERQLYNFSLEIGDTLSGWRDYIVDSIKFSNFAGKIRKVYYLHNVDGGSDVFKYIEGIGTMNHILSPFWWGSEGFLLIRSYLMCFYHQNELLFQNEENCFVYKDFLTSSRHSSELKLNIYPNPATHYFIVEPGSDINISKIVIHSLDGRLIRTLHNPEPKSSIATDDLSPGIYLVTIFQNTTPIFHNKFIINK